jgi:hypothetical protein
MPLNETRLRDQPTGACRPPARSARSACTVPSGPQHPTCQPSLAGGDRVTYSRTPSWRPRERNIAGSVLGSEGEGARRSVRVEAGQLQAQAAWPNLPPEHAAVPTALRRHAGTNWSGSVRHGG